MENLISIIKEFEGIFGAILGSITTFIITDILKKTGTLKLYLMKYECIYWYYDKIKKTTSQLKTEDCEIDYCVINIIIDLYNSCEFPRIMRDVSLKVYNGKKLLGTFKVNNEDSRRMTEAKYFRVDNLNIVNVNAKESKTLNLSVDLPKEIGQILTNELK